MLKDLFFFFRELISYRKGSLTVYRCTETNCDSLYEVAEQKTITFKLLIRSLLATFLLSVHHFEAEEKSADFLPRRFTISLFFNLACN